PTTNNQQPTTNNQQPTTRLKYTLFNISLYLKDIAPLYLLHLFLNKIKINLQIIIYDYYKKFFKGVSYV
ncbi:hypothetical protein, partial [uncultured Brachyspira sp.]